MKITIDISSVPYNTGVSRYTANLVRELALAAPEDSLHLFSCQRSAEPIGALPLRHVPITPRVMTLACRILPALCLIGTPQVFHSWDWYLPKQSQTTAHIITVHDLAQFKFPKLAHPTILAHHTYVLNQAKRLRLQLIAVSESTKQDLIELFDIRPENISVTYQGLPREVQLSPQPEDVKRLEAEYGIKKPFFLIVGTQEPRKNIPNMIEAWRSFASDFDLVIAGKPGWQDLPTHTGLHVLGSVDSVALASLYQQAELLLYVSLYEGFGLPILEAFYHQTPVVTSTAGACAEIGGKAAYYADPSDVQSIKLGIQQALSKPDNFAAIAQAQLQVFEWDRVAQLTLSAYHRAYAQQH